MDHHSEGLLMEKNRRGIPEKQTKQSRRQVIRIDVLPDEVLLEIFNFYVNMRSRYKFKTAWQALVHVCRRWRYLVFRSPRRLDLRLYCTPKTPARNALDVWPALPLIIDGLLDLSPGKDNIIAALEQSNRVREVELLLDITGRQLDEVLASMQVSFPEMTELMLVSNDETPVLPDSFLGGSAPRLRILTLCSISFPGLPKLLLSATCLVHLGLTSIPHSGYISPSAMVASLSTLSSLETFHLQFQSSQSHPDWESQSLPVPTRSILPALHQLDFGGVDEYLEELVSLIDTPQLKQMDITFSNQSGLDSPRLVQFINCTPTLRALNEARVEFHHRTASISLRSRSSKSGLDNHPMNVSCKESGRQPSPIEQVLHPFSMVEDLYIEHRFVQLILKNDAIEDLITIWLELLLPFTAVKNLYLYKEFAPSVMAALQDLVGDRITEVLPGLQNIFVKGLEPSGPFQENIGQFVAARQLSGHPIVISAWDCFDIQAYIQDLKKKVAGAQ